MERTAWLGLVDRGWGGAVGEVAALWESLGECGKNHPCMRGRWPVLVFLYYDFELNLCGLRCALQMRLVLRWLLLESLGGSSAAVETVRRANVLACCTWRACLLWAQCS